VDARQFETVVAALGQVRPDVVINCLGIIKQLKAAKDPIPSLEVNALFPHRLAELCAVGGARLLHFSTDCVFSGEKGAYTEEDRPDPVDLYGHSKLLGEVDRPGCVTLRTSIIGRDYLKNAGLIEWFLSQRNGHVRGFRRAIYSGLSTESLARIVAELIDRYPDLSGIYHVASRPINKYDLLCRLRDVADLSIEIEPDDTFTIDRSLSPERFLAATGLQIPSWDRMIAEIAADLAPYDQWRREHDIG
jgi:dTDP-4-dehydrorhamnose reductase